MASDEVNFDQPVYRSLGHLGERASGASDLEDFEAVAPAVAVSTVEAQWMRSMPPLLKRQPAFKL